jgi:hypothetical protein
MVKTNTLIWTAIWFVPAVAAIHTIGIDTIVRAVIRTLFNVFG